MAYLTRLEIQSHLYNGIIREINREDNLLEFGEELDFPVEGHADNTYFSFTTGLYYKWLTNAYVPTVYQDNMVVAIRAAIAEAKGYLRAYDTDRIFAAVDDERNPILLLYVKDCAVWHYIQLANPAVDMAIRLTRYEKAIEWFKMVQSGKTNPDLPYPEVAPPNEPNNYMKWGSIPKRQNNF